MTSAACGAGPVEAAPSRFAIPGRNAATWAWLAFVVVAVMQATLIGHRAINWDEFWHYSQIHQLANGTLLRPLQTLHASAFRWVLDLPGTGVDHIVVIRLFMFASEMIACAALAGIAARFTDRTTGVLCALAYLGGGFVMQHGFSFRYDPPLTALLMSALWVLLCRPLSLRWIAVTGVLLGVAAMVSLKLVLYSTAFAGVIWLRWSELGRTRDYLHRLAAVGVVAVAAFGLTYLLHAQGIAGDNAREARLIVSRSAGAMFSLGAQPYWIYAVKQALLAPGTVLLVLVTPVFLWKSGRSPEERWALAGCFAPALLPLVYHNTAPYFYVFMLPPVLVACSVAMQRLSARYNVATIAALFVVAAAITWIKERESPIDRQRDLLVAASEIFPHGVAYFDFCGFLGSFPKANPFMTPVSLRNYHAGALPSLVQSMQARPVPLVVDDDPMFERLLHTRDEAPEFLPGDAAALRASYIPFWGPFWIAGKEFAPGENVRFDLLVSGPYTIEGAPLTVDGVARQPGSVIDLQRGMHTFVAGQGKARIVWGERLQRPSRPAPEKPHWTYF